MKKKFQSFIQNKKLFASYLAGLWEGDGQITLAKRSSRGKCINTPALHITFKKSNRPLVKKIISYWGGWIRVKKKNKALVP